MNPSNTTLKTLATIMTIPAERLAILEKVFMATISQTHNLRRQDDNGLDVDGFYIYRVRHLLGIPIEVRHNLPDLLRFFKDKAFLSINDALNTVIAATGIRNIDTAARNTIVDCIVNGKDRAIHNALDYPLTIERHYVFFTDFDA